MQGEWRDFTYAEYAKLPLENCYLLDEDRLLGKVEDGGLGYKIEDLIPAMGSVVPYGGLSDIKLQAGETIIIAPATGWFGGRAVEAALAMGARVGNPH
jgi:NADPH-dependent curcumin reductase CurA